MLYNVSTNKPMTVLNSQTSNVSSITALTFTQSDDQVVVGSNRGSMNVWDLNTLKSKGNDIYSIVLFEGTYGGNLFVFRRQEERESDCQRIL